MLYNQNKSYVKSCQKTLLFKNTPLFSKKPHCFPTCALFYPIVLKRNIITGGGSDIQIITRDILIIHQWNWKISHNWCLQCLRGILFSKININTSMISEDQKKNYSCTRYLLRANFLSRCTDKTSPGQFPICHFAILDISPLVCTLYMRHICYENKVKINVSVVCLSAFFRCTV